MKTYHGERTDNGCEVTVDGGPLRHRSDLSGSASSGFDWGFIGTGQLSLALLSDFLGDDSKVKSLYDAFEKKVIAELPHHAWTLTGQDLAKALIALSGPDDAPFLKEKAASSQDIVGQVKIHPIAQSAGEVADAANQVAAAAVAVGKVAHQVARECDGPADEAMSTANHDADRKADATNHAVEEAKALARSAADNAKRVVAKLQPTSE